MVSLPQRLEDALKEIAQRLSAGRLKQASEELSFRYRHGERGDMPLLTHPDHKMAYCVARMPATFASTSRVLAEIAQHEMASSVKSILDLGAGPGTGTWAAYASMDLLEKSTLVERDPEFIAIGQKLLQGTQDPFLSSVEWKNEDLTLCSNRTKADLVLFSYSLGEIALNRQKDLLIKAWDATQEVLTIIEPGTPAGFQTILAARKTFLEMGAYLFAPCPHTQTCPMAANDWCHFSSRLNRLEGHKQAKEASLGYEDEKYSYLTVTKRPWLLPPHTRILRHPLKRSGYVVLTLCRPGESQEITYSKKDGADYKQARKADWGDRYTESGD